MSRAPRKSTYKRVDVDKRVKHGHAGRNPSPTYSTWYNMMTRCFNPKSSKFHVYGGAGITVCERWKEFSNFLEDVGHRPSQKHSLDRYPNKSGNYEPGNVRWATQSEQCRNRCTTRRVLRSDGIEFPSLIDAAESVNGSNRSVWDVCIGKRKTHRGFGWRYI